MNKINPKFILRNYILQQVINKAENLDYTEINKVLELLQDPFELNSSFWKTLSKEEKTKYLDIKPKWAYNLIVNCSS